MALAMIESDSELLTRVAALLDALGPFHRATRAEKWRTLTNYRRA
jgi:hypothetical protein